MIAETLFLEVTRDEDALRIALSGEIDHHSVRSVRERIDTEVLKYRPRVLELELFHVSFMDSSGLGLILGRAALCEELGIEVKLLRPGVRVKKILRVAGLERLKNLSIIYEGDAI